MKSRFLLAVLFSTLSVTTVAQTTATPPAAKPAENKTAAPQPEAKPATPAAPATKPEAAAPKLDPQMEAKMKALSTPGEEHKMLQAYVGRWNHTVSWWMDPAGKPETSQGTSEIKSIMGGRFIQQEAKGVSMGQPFQGLGITGYDNLKKHFTTYWIDNMSTGSMVGTASFDKAKNALIDKGTFTCPMSPTGTRNYRAVWSTPQNDSFKYEMFSPDESGKEVKMMEIVYTKAK